MAETPQSAPRVGGTEDALRAEVAATLKEMFKNRARNEVEGWTEETPLKETGIDSFDIIECVFELEERYKVDIDFNANDPNVKMDTVGDVIDLAVRSIAAGRKS